MIEYVLSRCGIAPRQGGKDEGSAPLFDKQTCRTPIQKQWSAAVPTIGSVIQRFSVESLRRWCIGAGLFLAACIYMAVQTPVFATPQDAIELRAATEKMATASLFFFQRDQNSLKNTPAEEVDQKYALAAEAIEVFQKVAPEFLLATSLERLQPLLAVSGLQRPKSLSEVIQECRLKCTSAGASLIVGSLANSMREALEHLKASDQFGPIQSKAGFYASVLRPVTSVDLLLNLKFIYENDVLLEADFYTLENLERFLGRKPAGLRRTFDGGFYARWPVNDDGSGRGFRDTFSEDFSLRSFEMRGNPKLSASDLPKGRQGLLNLLYNDSELSVPTFSQVQQILGTAWRAEGEKPPLLDDPHGSARIVYSSTTKASDGAVNVRRIRINFAPGWRLLSFELTERYL